MMRATQRHSTAQKLPSVHRPTCLLLLLLLTLLQRGKLRYQSYQ
jgi:hypothetical protein